MKPKKNLSGPQIFEQLRNHKETLFADQPPQWRGLSERHKASIEKIPRRMSQRRTLRVAAGILILGLSAAGISVSVLHINDSPVSQQGANDRWYLETELWDEQPDTVQTSSADDIYELNDLSVIDQQIYILDMQIQWLAQPQW